MMHESSKQVSFLHKHVTPKDILVQRSHNKFGSWVRCEAQT